MTERKVPYHCNNIYYVSFSHPATLDGNHDSAYYVDKHLNEKAQAEQGKSNVVLIGGINFNQQT